MVFCVGVVLIALAPAVVRTARTAWLPDAHTAIALTSSPEALDDGSDLVVFWHGTAHVKDYLTLSCGPTTGHEDYLQRKEIKHHDAVSNAVRFSQLYMMRCNYTVKYFQYSDAADAHALVASIEVPMIEHPSTPKHGHLALTTALDAMVVMFNSASNRTPEVRYGLSPSTLANRSQGNSTTYSASDMCQAPATTVSQRTYRDPGYMHSVEMTQLQPETRYFYSYGNDVDGWSKVYQFVSRPSRGAKAPVKFIAYADMGVDSAPAGQSTANRVYEDVVAYGYESFLLHFGDISYARGEGSVWDKFFHLIEPYATRIPYMVSIGNHEYDHTSGGSKDPSKAADNGFHPSWGNYGDDSRGECSVPMFHRFHAPSTGHSLYWYSFDYGLVHVIQISSEHNWTRGSAQYEWLEQDLQRVDRTETPWVVLTSHRMMYSTQVEMGQNLVIAKHFRNELEHLLMTYQVNLVLVGHQHAYERSCPVYREKCVEDGRAPVHIVVGSAGFELDHGAFSSKIGNWSVQHANEYGHLRVTATVDKMRIEFLAHRTSTVYDEVELTPYM